MNTDTQRSTPETDAMFSSTQSRSYIDIAHDAINFARKLERERNAAREALSGRTVSCSHCNETAKQLDAMRDELQKVGQQRDAWAMRCDKLGVEAMREAIKEAHAAIDLQLFVRGTKDDTTQVRSQMEAALSKLHPFLKP